MSAASPSEDAASPRWDPLVRITHWAVAAAVLLNALVTEDGSTAHVWIGWTAFALLVLRLLWGVVGTGSARFSAFPPSIGGALTHLADMVAGRKKSYRSHNPAGALMVYALWGTLAVVTVTGISMAGSPVDAMPVAGSGVVDYAGEDEDRDEHDGEEGEDEMLEEVHEVAANLLYVLAVLHVAGVAVEGLLTRRNLVRPMVTGR